MTLPEGTWTTVYIEGSETWNRHSVLRVSDMIFLDICRQKHPQLLVLKKSETLDCVDVICTKCALMFTMERTRKRRKPPIENDKKEELCE